MMMNRPFPHRSLFFIVILSLTSSVKPLLIDLMIELQALTEFNAANCQALMNSLKGAIAQENKNDAIIDAPFDPNMSPEEQAKRALKRPFTFKDLAGKIPQDIREITEFITDPEPFARVGAIMPKGILLYGPPGTGKTSIARAIAGEAAADFFQVSATDFIELYVGMGPKRVRELFDQARQSSKAIIFIDEIDAIGIKRTGETNSEYRNTLNELLRQMDGFTRSNVTVIAATNRIEDLDTALLRPGRFDRLVEIALPDQESREDIFRLYCSRIRYLDDAQVLHECAQKSFGLSGADIKNVVNEAAVLAAREKSDRVTAEQLLKALEKAVQQKRKVRK